MDYEEILRGVDAKALNEIINNICTALIGKGLSFRQAETVMDLAKNRLKDAKI